MAIREQSAPGVPIGWPFLLRSRDRSFGLARWFLRFKCTLQSIASQGFKLALGNEVLGIAPIKQDSGARLLDLRFRHMRVPVFRLPRWDQEPSGVAHSAALSFAGA